MRYGEAGCSEIEVGIEFENGAAEQHGADMHQQEKRQIAARDCLNPGHRTTALLPVAQHKPDTAGDLDYHAEQQCNLNDTVPIDGAGRVHERNVRRDARQRRKMVCNVQTRKRTE